MRRLILLSFIVVFIPPTAARLEAEDFLCAGFLSTAPEPPTEAAAKPALSSTEGDRSALVLFAKFRSELPGQTQAPDWAQGIFDPERSGSFSHFYDTMSFGKLRVRGQVAPRRYESAQEAGAYLASTPAEPGNFGQFSLDILRQADADIDFSFFDNDGPDHIPNSGDDDGLVDAVFIVIATAPRDFLLAGATGFRQLGFDEQYITDDVGISGEPILVAGRQGTIQQGRTFAEAVGTMCHEYGHVLGLPDLFNVAFLQQLETTNPAEDSAGIGAWGLMGWGALGWNGDDGPNSFCAWSRMELGWAEVIEIAQPQEEVHLEDVGRRGTVFKIPLSSREFFLLENRRSASTYYDRHIPAEGLLIWHIVRTLFIEESRQPPYTLVDLECADGRWLDAGFPLGRQADSGQGGDNLDFWAHDATYTQSHAGNLGDSTDPFDGVNFQAFSPQTNPASHSDDGKLNIRIDGIRVEEGLIRAQIQAAPVLIEVASLNFSDANGDGVAMAEEEVQIQFSRLENRGGLEVNELRVVLHSQDPLVEIVQSETRFGSLPVGKATRGGGNAGFPRFHFTGEVVGTHTATLQLDIFADEVLVAQRQFTLTGVSPRQAVRRVSVVDRPGNGDGAVQVGEFIRLELEVEVEQPDLLQFLEFHLRSLDEGLFITSTTALNFFYGKGYMRISQGPEFLVSSHFAADSALHFEFHVESPFGAWKDTLSVPVRPGTDSTPPRVLGLRPRHGENKVSLYLPATMVQEGSPVKGAWARIYSAPDTSRLKEIPLLLQDDHYKGVWIPGEPGNYLLEGVVEDSLGNQGQGPLQEILIMSPPSDMGTRNTWKPLQPLAEHEPVVVHLAFAPGEPDVLYAATLYGLWRSMDGGETWKRTGLMIGQEISNIWIDALDPLLLYLRIEREYVRSMDGGATWEVMEVPGFLLGVDPVRSGHLYTDEPMLSTDGGRSWQAFGIEGMRFVQVHPADPHIVYTGRFSNRDPALFHSTNGGQTWAQRTLEHSFDSVLIDPHAPGGLYATGGDSIWYSEDNGRIWELRNTLPRKTEEDRRNPFFSWYQWKLSVHPAQPGLLFLGSANGAAPLQRSDDAGRTWEPFPTSSSIPLERSRRMLFPHPLDPQSYFLLTMHRPSQRGEVKLLQELLHTQDNGKNWEQVSLPENGSPAGSLAFDHQGRLYTGSGHRNTTGHLLAGIYFSGDGGFNWKWNTEGATPDAAVQVPIVPIEVLALDPSSPDFILAFVGDRRLGSGETPMVPGTPAGTYLRSLDSGKHWEEISSLSRFGGFDFYPLLVADIKQKGVFYIARGNTGVFRTGDFGETWEKRFGRVHGFALDSTAPQTLYAAFGDSVWSSADAGLHWEYQGPTPDGASVLELGFHPLAGQQLYAVTRDGFYLSKDRGKNWLRLSDLQLRAQVATRLRFDPHQSQRFYLVTGRQLLETTDGGKNWISIGTDLEGYPWFNDVVVDPLDADIVYAATPWGVYRLDRNDVESVVEEAKRLPAIFALGQNYPNPFNPQTTIAYQLSRGMPVRLTIYNILGQPVKNLVDQFQAKGFYRLVWDGRNSAGKQVANGVYFYELRAGEFRALRKMVLIK